MLDGNASARLNQHLVREQQVAVDVGGGYENMSRGMQGLFELTGTPRVRAAIHHILAQSRDEGHCYLTKKTNHQWHQ